MPEKPAIGSITWRDLTVPNADEVKNFYAEVVGCTFSDHNMGDYSDYVMLSAAGDGVAGVCHARGSNANIPPQWLVYITVEDVEASARRCTENGGKILDGPRTMGGGDFCVIQDPAGAICALYTPGASKE